MKPSDVAAMIELSLLADESPMLWGAPGVGKTDVFRQVGAKIGYDSTIVVPVSCMDPVDSHGVPYVTDASRTRFALPEMWPTTGKHLILVDELPVAPPALQAVFYPLFHEKALNGGEYKLPPGCGVGATGNRVTDRAVANRLSTALGSRLHHIDFDVDFEDWTKWALSAGVHLDVIFYHKLRHYEFLHKFDPSKNERTFPCPRTWEGVSKLHWQNPPERLRFETYAGKVGEAASADFCGFLRIKDKIQNPDVIMLKPQSADVPTDPAVLYATAAAIAQRAKKDNMDRVVQFAERLPEEFSTLLVVTAITRDKGLAATRPFQEWAAAHPNAVN